MKKVFSKDSTSIAFEMSGQGPVLILLGGALQHKSDQLMKGLVPLLAKDFTVISYDRRGRGDSTDTKPYAIERELEDLEAVISEAGGSAHVFGMSSGGTLALLAASKSKNIVKSAAYEAPFVPEQQVGSRAEEYISQLKKAVASDRNGRAVKLFLKRIGVPALVRFIMQIMPMWKKLKALAPTLVYDALIVGDGSVPKQLSNVTIPTLLLTGTSAQMKDAASTALAILPNARQQVLEGQTHNVKPAILAPELSKFFKAPN